MAAERVMMTLKSQILRNHLHTLWNPHRNQIAKRFPQFPFLLIPRNLLLPIRHSHLRPNPPSLLRLRPLHMSSVASHVPPPDSSTQVKTVRVVIKGRVQGVFYRNWTMENANELGLKGWVRNRRDGSVEALFSGSAEKVGEMQERCRRGPPSAVVTGLDVNPSSEDPGTAFERRSTV